MNNILGSLISRDLFAGRSGGLLKGKVAYAVHAGVLALVALLGWLDGGTPPRPATLPAAGTDRFEMPTFVPIQLGERRAQALAKIAFEPDPAEAEALATAAAAPAPMQDDPADPTRWRFVGTAKKGVDTVAFLIVADGKKVLTVSMSDTLPNGERIEAIGADRLIIADGASRRELKLFDPPTPEPKDVP